MPDCQFNASPVRQTASQSHNALRRHVRRISVTTIAGSLLVFSLSIAIGADSKKDDWTIRIIPATKSMPPAPFPMQGPRSPDRTGKPPANLPPLPAPERPEMGQQPRINPMRKTEGSADYARYSQIYRSIPYSRLEYQMNPKYRQELALALLFNQFPPPQPIIMQSGSMQSGNPAQSGMPPGGGWPPIVPYVDGVNYGGPTLPWPGMYPPGWYQY